MQATLAARYPSLEQAAPPRLAVSSVADYTRTRTETMAVAATFGNTWACTNEVSLRKETGRNGARRTHKREIRDRRRRRRLRPPRGEGARAHRWRQWHWQQQSPFYPSCQLIGSGAPHYTFQHTAAAQAHRVIKNLYAQGNETRHLLKDYGQSVDGRSAAGTQQRQWRRERRAAADAHLHRSIARRRRRKPGDDAPASIDLITTLTTRLQNDDVAAQVNGELQRYFEHQHHPLPTAFDATYRRPYNPSVS